MNIVGVQSAFISYTHPNPREYSRKKTKSEPVSVALVRLE